MITDQRQMGRNTTHVMAGSSGLVVVKRFDGEPTDRIRRYHNTVAWDRVQREHGIEISPEILTSDEAQGQVTFRYVDGATLQERLELRESWSEVLPVLGQCGERVAQVHSIDRDAARRVMLGVHQAQDVTPLAPGSADPLAMFRALQPTEYARSSGGELECWSMFHHDPPLLEALERWLTDQAGDRHQVPIHGDLRPDQFLTGGPTALVIDWEEWSVGPPGRDLAGVLGALVFDALMGTFAGGAVQAGMPMQVHEAFISRGLQQLEQMAPAAAAFLAGYARAGGVPVDSARLGADVGWVLIERVLARATMSDRLGVVDRAIAGIGRQALLHPDSVLSILTSEQSHDAA